MFLCVLVSVMLMCFVYKLVFWHYVSVCMFVCKIFERILFIWAIRHPASGYVQGINDLVTPFFVVYVFEYIGKCNLSFFYLFFFLLLFPFTL